MNKKTYTGLNIQFPISQLILDGKKTIETRTYPIPKKYLGKDMLMVETPGKSGKFKSRIVAIISFDDCFQYKNSKDFYKDSDRHCVDKSSPWAWNDELPKWAWKIKKLEILNKSKPLSKRGGIIFSTNLEI